MPSKWTVQIHWKKVNGRAKMDDVVNPLLITSKSSTVRLRHSDLRLLWTVYFPLFDPSVLHEF